MFIGTTRLACQDYEGAKKDFIFALNFHQLSNNFKIMLLNDLGLTNFKLNDYQNAKENFSECLRLDECHVISLNRRAETHYVLEEYGDAILDLKEVFKLGPSEDLKNCLQQARLAKFSNPVDNMTILGADENLQQKRLNWHIRNVWMNTNQSQIQTQRPWRRKRLNLRRLSFVTLKITLYLC